MNRKLIAFTVLLSNCLCLAASGSNQHFSVLDVNSYNLPGARYICTPLVRTLLGYTRHVLHLPDSNSVAVFSYASGAVGNWLFIIDSDTLGFQRYDVPNNCRISHGAALGSDGNIYTMPFENGLAFKFDVKTRTFHPIKVELPPGEMTWSAVGGKNSCIYFGTYPNACFGEYDFTSGKVTLFKQVAPDSKYVSQLSLDSNSCVVFKAWGPAQHYMAFDPVKRTFSPYVSEYTNPSPAATQPSKLQPPQGDQLFGDQPFVSQLHTADRHFAISFPSSRLWEIEKSGHVRLIADLNAPSETWFLERVPSGLLGISHFGNLFKYRFDSGKITYGQIDNSAPGGNVLMFVQAISPRCVIGANYSQQNLFKFDPQLENLDYAPNMISSTQGEPMCAIGYLGKAYIGIYTQAVVSYYDPGLPFKAQHNPRELTRLYNDCRQTRPRDAAVGSGHVFISTDSDYNYLGGALVMIDPATNKCEKFNQLIKDQNLSSIAYDHCTAALWGGTDRWGQMKSAPPTQPSSLIYAFDPKSKKVVRSLTIWPGSDESLILGITAKGLLLAANPASKELAVINTQSAREIFKGPSPFGQALPLKCIRARDGQLYCVFGDRMYRWNLEKFYIEPVAKSPQCIYLTEYAPGKWILADSRSLFKLSLN